MDKVNLHPSVKIAFVGTCALLATCLCFYLMFMLIAGETSAPVELDTVVHVSPAVTEEKPMDPVATRKKPRKMMPIEPPPSPDQPHHMGRIGGRATNLR